jgi:predicted nucleic acid-binding Zn ribbon protein
VGPQIAAVTQARSVGADGTLFVDVTTNAWMQELRLMEAELLGRLASAEGAGPPIVRIRWMLARK